MFLNVWKSAYKPFVDKKYHENYLFWPNFLACYYAKDVLQKLNDHDINFEEKEENSLCAPNLRPIEGFWAILKQKVYHHNIGS